MSRAFARPGRLIAGPLLWLLSLLYGALSALHRWTYFSGWRRQHRLPGLTIAIGNLAAGGTGKSPVTMRLAQILLSTGASPVILTRGYGVSLKRGDSVVLRAGEVVMPARSTVLVPDEARMQSALLPLVPVIAGPDRYAAAQRYLREAPAPTHWLLDDGFQHWPLQRDFDLVLLDAQDPLPQLLPLGRGRETAQALRRADLVVFTRCREAAPTQLQIDQVRASVREYGLADAKGVSRPVPVLLSKMLTAEPELSTDGRVRFDRSEHLPACLVSAIAQPEAFRRAVEQDLRLSIGGELSLPDHSMIDRSRLLKACQGQRSVLTTAKDYWRDPAVFAALPVPVFVLPLMLLWPEAEVRRLISQNL